MDACQLSVPRPSLLPASKNLHTSRLRKKSVDGGSAAFHWVRHVRNPLIWRDRISSIEPVLCRFFPNRDFFRTLLSCSLSRVQRQLFVSAVAEGAGSEERTAGDRTRRRRLNKLSCADWLPHDRGFVSGLPRSKGRASVRGPAHNRAGGFPTAALSPAVRTSGPPVVNLLALL